MSTVVDISVCKVNPYAAELFRTSFIHLELDDEKELYL